ncbi:WD40 repeat domain-containing protein [Pseudomonas sp. ML96]|uniref:WD40 repeat domain-containing protein n=1 Tax=Pseudomonas sp. ML96 TaxID=1523503 RepID=UPI0005BBCB41|nr:WD40 repeat domain-containing protein [Pseudomonas sp. ML96]
MQNHSRKLLLLILLLALLAGSAALLWRFILFPPIHPEFTQALFKQRFADGDRATSMRFHNASKRLLIGMESGQVHIWDATQREAHISLRAHQYRANQLLFSRDGSSFFSNSYFEDSTHLWDSESGKPLATIADARGPVALGPREDLYLIANNDGELMLYDLEQRQVLPERYKAMDSVTALASSPQGDLIAAGNASGSLQVWRVTEQDGRLHLSLLKESKPYETGNWILALGFSTDGQGLISANRQGGVSEWSTADLSKRRDIPSTLKWAHQATFADGMPWLALAGTLDPRGLKDGKIELIDLQKGEALRFPARSNFAVAEMLAPLRMGLIAHGRRITGATLD